MKPLRFIDSFLRLTRAWNLLIIVFSQFLVAAMLVGVHTLADWRLYALSLSTTLIAAAGYIINDYYDVKIDLVNKPGRVVIGKNITRRYAILFHSLLSFAGIGVGLFLNWRIGAINLVSAFFLWWYSNDLKRQPFIGNFTVALLTGLSILIVDALYQTGNILIVVYALFGFFMTLIREIIKDMEDLKGDKSYGCKTLPIIWGMRKTKQVIYMILVLFVTAVFGLNLIFASLPQFYFVLFLFPALLVLVVRLVRADTTKDFTWLSGFCKAIMLLGVLSIAFI